MIYGQSPAFSANSLGVDSFESAFGCGQKLPSDGVMIGMEWNDSLKKRFIVHEALSRVYLSFHS